MSEDIIVKVKITSDYHPEIYTALKSINPRHRAYYLRTILDSAMQNNGVATNEISTPSKDLISESVLSESPQPQSSNTTNEDTPYTMKKPNFKTMLTQPS